MRALPKWELILEVAHMVRLVVDVLWTPRAPRVREVTSPRRGNPPPPRPAPEPPEGFFDDPDPAFPDLRPLLRVGARVLDLGCGLGRNFGPLREQGFRPVGLDRSGMLLGMIPVDRRPPLVRADLMRLPLGDASVEAVVAWQVICLFPVGRVDIAVDEIHRVLAPGGLLVFSGCYGSDAWGYLGSAGDEEYPPGLLRSFEPLRRDQILPTERWPRDRWVVFARKAGTALPPRVEGLSGHGE